MRPETSVASTNETEAFPRHSLPRSRPRRPRRIENRGRGEVISHLNGLVGSKVSITLEIEAEINSGVPENVVRTVTEDSRTLKFSSQAFERE